MRDVRADFETELAEFNGESNHVHLLVNFPPKVALSKLVNSLKGVSSRRLRQEFPAWPGITGGRTGCSPGPTSPDRSAVRRSLSCASTSSSRTGPPETSQGPSAFTTGLKAGALADILVAGAGCCSSWLRRRRR